MTKGGWGWGEEAAETCAGSGEIKPGPVKVFLSNDRSCLLLIFLLACFSKWRNTSFFISTNYLAILLIIVKKKKKIKTIGTFFSPRNLVSDLSYVFQQRLEMPFFLNLIHCHQNEGGM